MGVTQVLSIKNYNSPIKINIHYTKHGHVWKP